VYVYDLMFQVCTSDIECFCDEGFAGTDCSEASNITLLRLTTTTTRPTVSLTTEFVNSTTNNTSSLISVSSGPATVSSRRHWTGACASQLLSYMLSI